MTNAERQKRYRDRKRGGPPAGRWAGHTSLTKVAKSSQLGRTTLWMLGWISRHAPDLEPALAADEIKIAPTYRRLRREYLEAVTQADATRPRGAGYRLTMSRRNGHFVVKWVRSPGPGLCPDKCRKSRLLFQFGQFYFGSPAPSGRVTSPTPNPQGDR